MRVFDDMVRKGVDPVLLDPMPPEDLMFFAGSFSLGWHSRANAPPPEGTWGAVLAARNVKAVAEKRCVAVA